MKYYLLTLNNNKYINPTKIGGVKVINLIPGQNDLDYTEGVEVLAYESGYFINNQLIDVLTGKRIKEDINTPGLSYCVKRPLNNDEVKRIKEIYHNLSEEELLRYKKGISEIEEYSKHLYNEVYN